MKGVWLLQSGIPYPCNRALRRAGVLDPRSTNLHTAGTFYGKEATELPGISDFWYGWSIHSLSIFRNKKVNC